MADKLISFQTFSQCSTPEVLSTKHFSQFFGKTLTEEEKKLEGAIVQFEFERVMEEVILRMQNMK